MGNHVGPNDNDVSDLNVALLLDADDDDIPEVELSLQTEWCGKVRIDHNC